MTSGQPSPTEAAGSGGRQFRRPGVVVIAGLVVVALAAFFLFRHQAVAAIDYSVSDGGRVLVIGADACKGDAQIHAEETDDAVTISAKAERKLFGGQTICQIATLRVELDKPLGERPVIDAYTGKELSESSSP